MAHANARTTVYARKLIVVRVLAGHRSREVATQLGSPKGWQIRLVEEGQHGQGGRLRRSAGSVAPPGVGARSLARLTGGHAQPRSAVPRRQFQLPTNGGQPRCSATPQPQPARK